MNTQEIFATKEAYLNAKIQILSIMKRFYEFLIGAELRGEKAADLAFNLYRGLDRAVKSREFSPEEKQVIQGFIDEYSPLHKYDH